MLTAKLPGVKLKEISLSYRRRTLTLRTEIRDASGCARYFPNWENTARAYYRALRLPSEIDPNGAKVLFRSGLLKVRLPKAGPPNDGAERD